MKILKRILFYLRLFPYFVSRNIQSKMSYNIDFFLGIIANIMRQSLGFIFIWVLFRNVPEIHGWNLYQMMFVYGMQAITLGLDEFLFAGTWSVSSLIQEGDLDRLLLRPVGPMFSIIASDVTFHGLGASLFGLVICIISLVKLKITLTAGMILFWIAAIVCGTLIYFSVNMICATLSFWVIDSSSAMMLMQNVSEFTKYPTSIYRAGLQILLTFIIPYAFTSYYPVAFLLGVSHSAFCWIGTFVAAFLSVLAAVAFWHFGLSKYQSAGG